MSRRKPARRSANHVLDEPPSIHTVQRSGMHALIVVVAAVVFLAGLANPRLSAAVGVTLGQGVLVISVFLGAVALAFLAFYRFGPTSRAYRACDYFESFALSWSIAYLIQASSDVHSFFWIFHGVQVFATALAGYSLLYLATVSVGPAYLAASFLWRGDTASAWISALAGIAGAFVYLNQARLSSQRDSALRREAALREELGHLWVARERSRISRDLHDNVATELTALVWKVREISDAVPNAPHRLDILNIAERLRSVIGDLRNVVLALRGAEPDFRELALMLERRCAELCGETRLRLSIDGEVESEELAVFQDHILPICFELASNAARHAQARHVELQIRAAASVQIVVSDDGRGLSMRAWCDSRGGLQGLRRRVDTLGGSIILGTIALGTRFVIDLPRPLRQRAPELAAGSSVLFD